MKIEDFSFGSIRIGGVTYHDDVVIDGEVVRNRDKKPSRKFRSEYGHTPISLEEDIPWDCRCLIIGTGIEGKMPLRPEIANQAERRQIELVVLPTALAIEKLQQAPQQETNAILHITC
jgi:hypothetical protein